MRSLSILFSLALGAAFIAAPSLLNIGSDSNYDSAFAAKGGNGKGNGGGNGNGHGKNDGASANAKGSGKRNSGQMTTSVASTSASGKQKMSAKQLALTDPTAPAHPSMLGRWNAAKPLMHPAMQAHIRNGNYTGTIGMLAAYGQAQTAYNELEAQAAAAATAATDLAAALMNAGYGDPAAFDAAAALAEYQAAAALDSTLAVSEIDGLIAASQDVPTAEEIAAAQAELATTEANMEAYSNRAPWEDIRDDVRARMGLDPAENDLVTEAPPSTSTATP
jgi:hypothetical protein